MPRSHPPLISDSGDAHEGLAVELRFSGRLSDRGEIPAVELAAALQGWDRLLQLAYFSQEMSLLTIPERDTNVRVEFRVKRARKGTFVVDAMVWLANAVGEEVIVGGVATLTLPLLFKWTKTLVAAHIAAKRDKKTLDATVEAIEAVARQARLRVSNNRQDSETFVVAMSAALDNATVPLDSSAARAAMKIKGQTIDIVFDEADRAAIRTPFATPTLDLDAADVIEAPVRFVRINKKTGKGLMNFVKPADASQVGQQSFHSIDKALRQRANQYTGAFHTDDPLSVRMQLKAYDQNRHGHYWLIVGTSEPDKGSTDLFGNPVPGGP